MNTPPVGIASAWSTLRMDAVQQALETAVLKQQAKADEAVIAMVDRATAGAAPAPPEGQGRMVDIRA
jgi:hypothetical protein